MTSLARRKGLASQFDDAHAMLDEAQVLAGDDPVNLGWCAIERGRLYNSAGLPERALTFFERAWKLAQSASEHNLAVDALHMLAIATPVDTAAAWTRVALDYIAAHPRATHWKGPLYNNIGWHYFEAERYEDALDAFRLGVLARENGGARELRIAHYTVIRTLRALGRLDEAIALGEHVVEVADAAGEAAPFVYEEKAECHAGRDPARAAAFAGRALASLAQNAQFVAGERERLERLQALVGGATESTG